ncbi:phage portal protein [Rhizobium leguminosarum]|uniref:portal protein n=1 Tax=Rhizobium leguminosarum TaxID=384 RepID=UPI001030AB93|nr:phage portal protein [Rhizobium leguminosarum]TBG78613.1 phage portal protein [Rhizobium leguminosarum]
MAEAYSVETESTANSELDDLTRKLKAWVVDDMPKVVKWRKEGREAFGFYAGGDKQWSDDDINALRAKRRPVMTFNRTAPLVNAVVGSEINNRREVQYIPREEGDALADEILTAAGEWFRDQTSAEDEESDAFEDTVITGMGWTDTRLDFESEPDGAPVVERMDNLKMGWDCNATKPNLKDAQRLWYVCDKPYSEVQEMFPKVAKELLCATWAKTLTNDPDKPHDQDKADRYEGDQEEFTGDYGRKMCTLVEIRWFEKVPYYRGPALDQFGMPTAEPKEYSEKQIQLLRKTYPNFPAVRQYKKIVKRAFIGKQVLAEPDQPLVPPGMFGWECITGYRDKIDGLFYGIVRAVQDPQRWSNKFFSQVMYLLNSQSKGGLLAEKNAFDDPRQAEDSWAKSDAITWLKDGSLAGQNPRVKEKPTAQFPTGFFALFNESKEAISQVTGLSPEFLGTREVDQAGVLEYQRKQSSLNLLASLFNALRRYRKRQGKTMLFLIQNHLSDGRLIRIVGDGKARYVPLVKKAEAQYDIIVDDAPTSPNEKERTWGVLLQLMPFVKQFMSPETTLEVLEYSPLPASLVQKWKDKAEQAKQEAAQNPPPPSPEEIKAQSIQAKGQLDIQAKQMDMAADEKSAEMDAAGKMLDLFVKGKEAEIDLALGTQKAQLDAGRLAVAERQNEIRAQNANTRRGSSAD